MSGSHSGEGPILGKVPPRFLKVQRYWLPPFARLHRSASAQARSTPVPPSLPFFPRIAPPSLSPPSRIFGAIVKVRPPAWPSSCCGFVVDVLCSGRLSTAHKVRLRDRSYGASISERATLCRCGDAEQGRLSDRVFRSASRGLLSPPAGGAGTRGQATVALGLG